MKDAEEVSTHTGKSLRNLIFRGEEREGKNKKKLLLHPDAILFGGVAGERK